MAEIRISATGELKLYDSDDSNYVSFKSAGTVSSNVAWTLPSADGSNGQVLQTNGSGTLSFATVDTSSATDSFSITGSTPTLTIGDAGAEDTKIVFDGNAQDWHIGLDDSADDLVIGLGSTLGTTSHIVIDEAGHVTMPLTSAFMAEGPAASQDVNTTNATTVTISTERFDQNSDYNTSTYTFTAPVTGRYQLNANVVATDIEDEYLYLQIVTSNNTYGGVHQIPDTSGAEYELISVSHLVDMDASDTAVVQVNSESDTSFDLRLEECEFSGYLAC